VQGVVVQPQLAAEREGALAQEGEVALIDLRQHGVRRSGQVDRRLQAVLAGDAARNVGVALLLETARTALHPKILQPVLGENGELRDTAGRKTAFERHDPTGEKALVGELDVQALAKLEPSAVEQGVVVLAVLQAPVAENQFGARQAIAARVDAQFVQRRGEVGSALTVDLDHRAGAVQGKGGVRHGFWWEIFARSMGKQAQRAGAAFGQQSLPVDRLRAGRSGRGLGSRRGGGRRRLAGRRDFEFLDDDAHGFPPQPVTMRGLLAERSIN
jgi:hypothetical protein